MKKKLLSLAIGGIITLTSTSLPAISASAAKVNNGTSTKEVTIKASYRVTIEGGTYLYSSVPGPAIAYIASDTSATVYDTTENGWYYAYVDGKSGYVSADDIEW